MSEDAYMGRMWMIVDLLTGERASIASFFDRGRAEAQIEEWKERQKKGGRPDVPASLLSRLGTAPIDRPSDRARERQQREAEDRDMDRRVEARQAWLEDQDDYRGEHG